MTDQSATDLDLSESEHLIVVATLRQDESRLFSEQLSQAGFPVLMCYDGAGVLETVEKHCPHLLIIDGDIEWIEGTPIVLRIHADPAFATLPVLIILPRVNDLPAWARHDGYTGNCYITRPFPSQELLVFVKRILQSVIAGKLPPFPKAAPSTTFSEDHWQIWRQQLPPFALFDASWHGDLALVTTLLDQGVDARSIDRQGWTALHSAASGGHAAIATRLLQGGAKVNAASDEGMTPLILASMNAQVAVMRMLLDHGAHPNSTTTDGDTALLRLLKYRGTPAYLQRQEEAVGLLLKFGANPNARNGQGETALQRAHVHLMVTIEQLLLDYGAQT